MKRCINLLKIAHTDLIPLTCPAHTNVVQNPNNSYTNQGMVLLEVTLKPKQ